MFLRQMHDLDYSEISLYTIDNKQNVLEEYQLLKDTIYDSLTDIEKQYVEDFMQRLHSTTIFDGKNAYAIMILVVIIYYLMMKIDYVV